MATPRVLGHELRLTANLCLARDASAITHQYAQSFRNAPMQLTHQRFVRPATTCDNADHATYGALDNLLRAGWELDAGLALVWVVADDGNVVAGSPAQRTTVAHLLLDVAHNGTLGHRAEREHVANGERGVLAGVDELASVHALVRDEGLGVQLEAVRVAEGDSGEWRATACIVDYLLDDAANVSMPLL